MSQPADTAQWGVLLLAFGGPSSMTEIPLFLHNLLGRTPPPGVTAATTERYRLLGGGSPLPAVTRRQG